MPQSIAELIKLSDAFGGIITATFGVVVWEYLLCFVWFDWRVLTGRIKIRWPISIYYINRVAGLILILCTQLHLPPSNHWVSNIDCFVLDTLLRVAVGLIAFCSLQVIVWRTWTLFDSPKKWFWPCILILTIQPALYAPIFMFADLLDPILRGSCSGRPTMAIRNGYFAACFAYTVAIYFICLVLSLRRLMRIDGETSLKVHIFSSKKQSLATKFIRGGIFYFVATLLVSLPIALSDLYSHNIILELILALFFAACDMILTGRQIIEWHDSNHRGASLFFVGGKRLRPLRSTDLRAIGVSSMIVTYNDVGEELSSDDDSDDDLSDLSIKNAEGISNLEEGQVFFESRVDKDRIVQPTAQTPATPGFVWDPEAKTLIERNHLVQGSTYPDFSTQYFSVNSDFREGK